MIVAVVAVLLMEEMMIIVLLLVVVVGDGRGRFSGRQWGFWVVFGSG